MIIHHDAFKIEFFKFFLFMGKKYISLLKNPIFQYIEKFYSGHIFALLRRKNRLDLKIYIHINSKFLKSRRKL